MENTHLMFETQLMQRRWNPILRIGAGHVSFAIAIFSAIVCFIHDSSTAYEQLAPLYAISIIAMTISVYICEPGEYMKIRSIRAYFGNTKYQAYFNVTNHGLSIFMSEKSNYAKKRFYT